MNLNQEPVVKGIGNAGDPGESDVGMLQRIYTGNISIGKSVESVPWWNSQNEVGGGGGSMGFFFY